MEVKRATFEQVQKAQEDLIFAKDGIDKLIELNETISPDSRSEFFRRLAYSLLGKGLDYPVILIFKGNRYNLGSVSEFSRKMAYYTDTNNKKQKIKLKGEYVEIPNCELWKALREALYKPMDEALTLALKSSAEIYRSGSDAYEFDPSKK